MSDFRGYSYSLVKAVQAADSSKIGVQLGMLCIEKNIPASEIAEHCNVSKVTVYQWFKGQFIPRTQHMLKLKELLARLQEPAV